MINVYRAKILEAIVNSDGPITLGMLNVSLDMPTKRIWINLKSMVKDGDIEERNFKKEGMTPHDYRINLSSMGGSSPKSFYIPTPKGMKKLEYYRKKGVLDSKVDTRKEWQKKQKAI